MNEYVLIDMTSLSALVLAVNTLDVCLEVAEKYIKTKYSHPYDYEPRIKSLREGHECSLPYSTLTISANLCLDKFPTKSGGII